MIALLALLACQPTAPDATPDTTPVETDADTDTDTDTDTDADTDADTDTGPEGQCALVSDLASPWLWEGDTVVFAVACTGSLAQADTELTLLKAPAGAALDPVTWSLTWQTGPADGGRADVIFSARPRGSSAIPETLTVTVWVADNPALKDAVPVDPATYTEEWGLPVVHMLTSEALTQTDQVGEVVWYGDTLAAELKIRGASSASYPKPSYTLTFTEYEIELPWQADSRDHLILLTTFDDNSYVRQKLVYDQWAAMADFWEEDRLTPRTAFVVVYLNAEYHGLYVALDRIDNEFVRQMGLDDEGDLYKSVSHDANFYLTSSSGSAKTTLHDGYEKTEGKVEYDFSSLDALVSFTGSAADARALVEGAPDWLSLDEYMDWFLLVHYTLAEDSAGKNAYLYEDPGTGLFRYVPWDFNHAWGQNWYTARTSASSLNTFTSTNRIFWAVQTDPDAAAALWDRFDQLRADDGPMSLAWQTETVDHYYAQIQPSAERDWAYWAESYSGYSRWSSARSSTWEDFEGEKTYLYDWMTARAALFEETHPSAR